MKTIYLNYLSIYLIYIVKQYFCYLYSTHFIRIPHANTFKCREIHS